MVQAYLLSPMISPTGPCFVGYTVKSRFNEWPPSAHFDSLNRDLMHNRGFLTGNFISVTRFCILNRDNMSNRYSLNRDFTVLAGNKININHDASFSLRFMCKDDNWKSFHMHLSIHPNTLKCHPCGVLMKVMV